MNLGRCPYCHHHLDIHAMALDEAARELLALMARLRPPLAMDLLAYIGLFRPEKRDLSHDRALRLVNETLELTTDQHLLGAALRETVDAIQRKRAGGDTRPLKNHNYAKEVLAGIAEKIGQAVPTKQAPAAGASVDRQDPGAERAAREREHQAWREQMRKLGRDPDAALAGTVKRLGYHHE